MLLKLQNRPYEQCFIKLNTRNSRAKSSHCRGSCQASLSTQKDIKDNRVSRQGRRRRAVVRCAALRRLPPPGQLRHCEVDSRSSVKGGLDF